MNFPDPIAIPDVQSTPDGRALAIDRVGVRGLRYPLAFVDRDAVPQQTVALCDLCVALPGDVKGTHMSRFVELMERRREPLSVEGASGLLAEMLALLEAREGRLEVVFPFFVRKAAPVSGVESLLDYEVTLGASLEDGLARRWLKVVVPVTALCPCSKKISAYGAHNQRSHLTLAVELARPLWVRDLIDLAEGEASSPLYGILKRPDEKFVTEAAYDNPKFVEDVVRDLAGRLKRDPRVAGFAVEAENFESIHNHSAYAAIRHNLAG